MSQATAGRGVVRELATITVGVLIALSLENCVQNRRDRALVRQARTTIAREIADNRTEIASVVAAVDKRRKNLDSAMRLANDLLANRQPTVHELQLGFEIPDLRTTGWQTAASTGALGHMDYGEVQKYADAYGMQSLYAERQQGMMDNLAAAVTIFSDGRDPDAASTEDLQAFRRHVLAMQADLVIDEQLARKLLEIYDRTLKSQ